MRDSAINCDSTKNLPFLGDMTMSHPYHQSCAINTRTRPRTNKNTTRGDHTRLKPPRRSNTKIASAIFRTTPTSLPKTSKNTTHTHHVRLRPLRGSNINITSTKHQHHLRAQLTEHGLLRDRTPSRTSLQHKQGQCDQ